MGIIFILGLFLVIPTIITFSVPPRYFEFYVAWLAMAAVLYAALPSGSDHSSPFAGMGTPFALMCGAAIAVIVAIRGAILTARRALPDSTSLDPATGAWTCTGALAAFCALAILARVSSPLRPVAVAYLPAAATVAGAIVLALRARRTARADWRAFTAGFAGSAALTFAAGVVWAVTSIPDVTDAAEKVAGDKPYCIQVAAPAAGYEPARSRLALSPITMRAGCSGGWCWQNHAILVIDNGSEQSMMHWSYRNGEFRNYVHRSSTEGRPLACEPAPHFARGLPWF